MAESVLYAAVTPWQRAVSPLRVLALAVIMLALAVILVVASRADNRARQAQVNARIDSLCVATATVLAQTGFVAGDAALKVGAVHDWQLEDPTQLRAALGCAHP